MRNDGCSGFSAEFTNEFTNEWIGNFLLTCNPRCEYRYQARAALKILLAPWPTLRHDGTMMMGQGGRGHGNGGEVGGKGCELFSVYGKPPI